MQLLTDPALLPQEQPLEIELTSPPLAQEFLDELAALADENDRAIEQQNFDDAQQLRNRERRRSTSIVEPATSGLGARLTELSTGAEMRVTGVPTASAPSSASTAERGPTSRERGALRWSGLSRRLAPRFPDLAFGEVKYRIKSWKRLDMCAEDALAAIEQDRARLTRS